MRPKCLCRDVEGPFAKTSDGVSSRRTSRGRTVSTSPCKPSISPTASMSAESGRHGNDAEQLSCPESQTPRCMSRPHTGWEYRRPNAWWLRTPLPVCRRLAGGYGLVVGVDRTADRPRPAAAGPRDR